MPQPLAEIDARAALRSFIRVGSATARGTSRGLNDVAFESWLWHRPQPELRVDDGLRAAMSNGEPVTHLGSELLSAVRSDYQTEHDQCKVMKLFEMEGLPGGWRASAGEQLLKSKSIDAMTKLRIAAKMARSKGA